MGTRCFAHPTKDIGLLLFNWVGERKKVFLAQVTEQAKAEG